MKRREILAAAMSIAGASEGLAQPGRKLPRLAIVSPSAPIALMVEDSSSPYFRVLFETLRRRGWIEGKTFAVDRYGQEHVAGSQPALIETVLRGKPDVIYAIAGAAFLKAAAMAAPVVALSNDPIAMGLIQNLAKPGGNITGMSVEVGPLLHGKRIELLREAFPALSELIYVNLRASWDMFMGAAMRAAADGAGVRLLPKLLDGPAGEEDYRRAIAESTRAGGNALMIGDSPLAFRYGAAIVAAVAETKLPAMYAFLESVEAGGLMAYSFDLKELNRRAAENIDAILRGTSPGDIPYFQATTFNLSINLGTAKAQGITFPPSILARADQVIE
ncbi:MAG: ABC transporter substrate-binding protein [Reyranella sp.]|nr:ABC transporter substrate-binding protein [Reyranella sp.]MDP3163197.1 ABC transporter substrate-binding protein [Reyranella sp.]